MDGLAQPGDEVAARIWVAVVRRSNGGDEQRQSDAAHGSDAIVVTNPFVVYAMPFRRTRGFQLFDIGDAACQCPGVVTDTTQIVTDTTLFTRDTTPDVSISSGYNSFCVNASHNKAKRNRFALQGTIVAPLPPVCPKMSLLVLMLLTSSEIY
jgi:hypothetical protein